METKKTSKEEKEEITKLEYENIREYLLEKKRLREESAKKKSKDSEKGYFATLAVSFIFCTILFFILWVTWEFKGAIIISIALFFAIFCIVTLLGAVSSGVELGKIILSGLKNEDDFFCPVCLKAILSENMTDLECSSCGVANGFMTLVEGCSRCKRPLKYFQCPHCKTDLDFLTHKYNLKKIEDEYYG
ncbi:MAG: hypothetical protein JSS63_03580 [Bacteroidetes bacterium]|nr:hypothetical protein [Bacteroidota bacterium]